MTLEKTIIKQLIQQNPQNQTELINIIRKIAGQVKASPVSKTRLLKAYKQMLADGEIASSKSLEFLLTKRAIRTLSGVAPITVMTMPMGCPKNCLYCPTEINMPKSYLSNQPAAMRAVLSDFAPFRQITARIRALQDNGHQTDKIEVIINGGTWSAHPLNYQAWFIYQIFKATNEYSPESSLPKFDIHSGMAEKIIAEKLTNLEEHTDNSWQNKTNEELMKLMYQQQKINETTKNRIIGITLETRPDHIDFDEVVRMRQLGATKVELGVQHIDDKVLELNKRGHDAQCVKEATQLLKDAGFKVAYHIMPGMYGSTITKDKQMFKDLFSKPEWQPDFLKIYPCVVIEQSELYKIYQAGKFKPYSQAELLNLMIDIKQYIPETCRLVRLFRDIPSNSIEGGNKITNFRETIQKEMKKQGKSCQCIRCREPRNYTANDQEPVLKINEFTASQAKEYFISLTSPDNTILYAFIRLRLPNFDQQILSKEQNHLYDKLSDLKKAAIIREIHTYGQMVPLNSSVQAVQHQGLGKKLMSEAEKIAQEHGYQNMAVISGIGVRGYYEKLGYHLADTYMVKKLV